MSLARCCWSIFVLQVLVVYVNRVQRFLIDVHELSAVVQVAAVERAFCQTSNAETQITNDSHKTLSTC